jgi:hypothetical protein
MHVHYWAVGQRTPAPLSLTLDSISGYLVEDWIPSIVPPPGSTFIGWPTSLIRSEDVDGTEHWSLDPVLGRTERQWKSVISWMLGVAGARHLLMHEGYRWIAPVSAFYPGAEEVDTTHWHPRLPRGVVEVTGPNRFTNLRPDYLAIRPRRVTGVRTLAAVEAKGTGDALGSALRHRCPPAWRRQVWNIAVTVHGQPVRVSRHIVAATRVNPNAKRARTRCLQIRGWNSEDPLPVEAPPQLAVEVAAGHLFGLCLNLGLWRNARAIALAVGARAARRSAGAAPHADEGRAVDERLTLGRLADKELREQTDAALEGDAGVSGGLVSMRSGLGELEVEITDTTMSLIRSMRAPDPEQAAAALDHADDRLDEMDVGGSGREGVLLPSGVRVRYVPREARL